MYTYMLSMGSNVGDRCGYIEKAVKALEENPHMQSIQVSSLIETPPWGNTKQGAFINAAAMVKTDLEPEDFLRSLQAIELANGRERVIHWGPRTLDLDIIWCQEDGQPVFWKSEALCLPHPYFWERTFVLAPMAELWPDFVYGNQSIEQRLHELEDAESF